jgi:uncharacterized repeat protein (TIGR03806 family)
VELAQIVATPWKERSLGDRQRLTDYYRSVDPGILELRNRLGQLEQNLVTEREAWERSWTNVDELAWVNLDPEKMVSDGGATFTKLDDDSVLVSGDPFWHDTYVVDATANLNSVGAFRIEALPDSTLEGGGPGRTAGGNFVLSEFDVLIGFGGRVPDYQQIPLQNAFSPYSQPGWSAEGAIDQDPESGWAIAPYMGRSPTLLVEPQTAILSAGASGIRLRFIIRHNYDYGSLGRFRISVRGPDLDPQIASTPGEIAQILRTPADLRSDDQQRQLAEYFVSKTEVGQTLSQEISDVQAALLEPDPVIALSQRQWERRTREAEQAWTVLKPTHMEAANDVELQLEEDGSISPVGPVPTTTDFNLRIGTSLTNITAFRLETFLDPSLEGPGRSPGGNFVLSEFVVWAAPFDRDDWTVLAFPKATADFSQAGYDVSAAVDGNLFSGWAVAPRVRQEHQAVFQLDQPAGFPDGTQLAFSLKQWIEFGTMGRFRISATTSASLPAASSIPPYISRIAVASSDQRTPQEQAALDSYHRAIAPELDDLHNQLDELRQDRAGLVNNNHLSYDWLGYHVGIVSMGLHPQTGEILLVDYQDGDIKRLVYDDHEPDIAIPAKLSQTGAFSDLAALKPNPGIIPYDVNVSFWSDHAQKSRWFCVPAAADVIGFSATNNWIFPDGTVWIKHFELAPPSSDGPNRRVETRFLVRKVGGGIYGITYRWNEQGTDADLVPAEGFSETIPIWDNGAVRMQTWQYPSRSQCLQCHNASSGLALGFNTFQLNRPSPDDPSQNQIGKLQQAGYLSGSVPDPSRLLALAPSSDETISLDFRARSYLHANCVQCHQPAGGLSSWDARITTPLADAKLINALPIFPTESGATKIIDPGSPENSILWQRLSKLGKEHMPPLATSEINDDDVALIERWITERLPGFLSFSEWQQKYFSDAPDVAARDADPDGDGLSNYAEYLLGSDPRVPSPSLPLAIKVTDDGVLISFQRVANLFTQVEWADEPSASAFQPLEVSDNGPYVPLENEEAEILDPTPNATTRFYRLVLRPP